MVIKMMKISKDKRGWIRVVEAVTAVLLILGAVLVILDKGYIAKTDISEEIYKIENSILMEIQLNDSMRNEIREHKATSGSG